MITARSQPTFVVTFAVTYAIFYVVSVEYNLALFTYHPALEEFDFLVEKAKDGPAMYWYGWIATSALGASILGFLAALLPEKIRGKIPLALAWVVPVALVPVVIYSLRFYWRW